MEHLTLKAATTQVTDQGVFEAVISTETADREQDVVSADAMVTALKKWNRPVPLAWNHSSAAEDIIGSVEPMTAAAKDGEVVVQGQVDLESDVGREAWRSFKSRTIGFSFGYLALASSKREGGGRNLTEVDIFEVTATPTPMNNETRVLSTKGAETVEVTVTADETRVVATPPDDGSDAPHLDDHRKVFELVTGEIPGSEPEGDPDRADPTVPERLQVPEGSPERDALLADVKAIWERVLDGDPDDAPDGAAPADLLRRLREELDRRDKAAADEPDPPDKPDMDDHRRVFETTTAGVPWRSAPSLGAKAAELVPDEELEGLVDGELTVAWSTAYLKSLPDDCFLYERRFPVAGQDGSVDLPHLRDALLRGIPRSDLDQDVKDRLTRKAQAMAIEDAPDEDPVRGKSRAQDPPPNHDEQRRLYEMATEGIAAAPPTPAKAVEPPEIPPRGELHRRYYDLMLETSLGSEETQG